MLREFFRHRGKGRMDELAKLSGVSKSMLAQVERGEGNPTLSTLWKLSNGMKVPFNALTVSPKAPYEVVRTAEMQPILEDGGKVKNYCLFPDDENRKFSVYYMELAPGQPLAVGAASAGYHRVCHPFRRCNRNHG